MADTALKPAPRNRRVGIAGFDFERFSVLRLSTLVPYLASMGLVGAATAVSAFTFNIASSASLTLVYLIAVVISAQRYGLWPAVVTSLLSVLSWDYYFTLPYYNLYFSDPHDYFALIGFLTVSLIVSGMTAQILQQNARLARLAESISGLYSLSQEFSQFATVDELAAFTISRLSKMFDCDTIVILRDHADPSSKLVFPPGESLEARELASADGVFFELSIANRLDRDPGGRYGFLPLNALHGRIGSVGLSRPSAPELTGEERQELNAFLSQAALAIERAWLARDIEHAQMTAETERLRNALLTSVSHDLRTPLTTIIGALSTLSDDGASVSPAVRDELISTARSEAERLNRFIGNLLDITKLEAGTMKARLVPTDVAEVVESALDRAQPLLAGHAVDVNLPPELPLVSADFAMLEQVFFNLLDNAAKYSPPTTRIEVRGAVRDDAVVVEVCDEGAGFPESAREKLFEKFTRFAQGDSKAPGTGLGLMICRGFLEIMHGSIIASNRPEGRGAMFSMRLERAASL